MPDKTKRIYLCIFNRASYGRHKILIERLGDIPNIELTVLLSSSMLWEEFGNAAASYATCNNPKVKHKLIKIEYLGSSLLNSVIDSSLLALRFGKVFSEDKPDAVILIADRYETLPAAMAASYQNIPIIHIQGGEITGNIDDKVRHAVTQLSDYHFACTPLARKYLLLMGQDPKRVWDFGCPSLDLIKDYKIKRDDIDKLNKKIIVIFHPETENHQDAYKQTEIVLRAVTKFCLAHKYYKCIWYYPNNDPGRESIINLLDGAVKHYSKHLFKAVNEDPVTFLRRLAQCRLIVGNSSCGIRESSYLGVPSINIGERQRLRQRALNVVDAPFDKDQIIMAMENQNTVMKYKPSFLYGTGQASKYIADKISSLDIKSKGPLTYPYRKEFYDIHFTGKKQAGKMDREKSESRYLQGESKFLWSRDDEGANGSAGNTIAARGLNQD